MRHKRNLVIGRATCALVLSCLLATSPLVDGVVAMGRAYADEPVQAPQEQRPDGESGVNGEANTSEGVDANGEAPSEPSPSDDVSGQLSQEVPLEGIEGDARVDGGDAAPSDADGEAAPEAGAPGTGDRVTADVPLEKEEAPAATAGTVIVDGLKYQVNSDGETAELSGWHGAAAPEGDVTVAAKVVSGQDEYAVTKVAKEALKGCDKVETVVLPNSVAEIGKDAFAGCSALRAIEVGEACERFASYDGMLFSNDLSTLVLCPEGKGSGGGGLCSLFAR